MRILVNKYFFFLARHLSARVSSALSCLSKNVIADCQIASSSLESISFRTCLLHIYCHLPYMISSDCPPVFSTICLVSSRAVSTCCRHRSAISTRLSICHLHICIRYVSSIYVYSWNAGEPVCCAVLSFVFNASSIFYLQRTVSVAMSHV